MGAPFERQRLSNTELRLGDGEYKFGSSLHISDCENVSLIGTGKTRIVTDNESDTVISSYGCKNLLLYGLTVGHDVLPMTECSSGVLVFNQCEGVTVMGCDIFGCGYVGINTMNDVTVIDAVIRDCSNAAVTAFADCVVHFINSIIQENKGAYLFQGIEKTKFVFDDCVIQNNLSNAEFRTFEGGVAQSVERNHTVEENNAWQK